MYILYLYSIDSSNGGLYCNNQELLRFKRQLSSSYVACVVDDEDALDDRSGWRCLAGATPYEPRPFFFQEESDDVIDDFKRTLKSRVARNPGNFSSIFDYDWSLVESKRSFRQLIKRHFRDSSVQYISKRGAPFERAPARFESSNVQSMKDTIRNSYGNIVRLFHMLASTQDGNEARGVAGADAVKMAFVIRHVRFIQQAQEMKSTRYFQIDGLLNPVDPLTKWKDTLSKKRDYLFLMGKPHLARKVWRESKAFQTFKPKKIVPVSPLEKD